MQRLLLSITSFWTCTCFWFHKRKLVDELILCWFVLLSTSVFLSITNPLRKPSSCKSWKGFTVFHRSSHPWFSNSLLYPATDNEKDLRCIPSEWRRIKSSWGFHCSLRGGFWTVHMLGTFLPEWRASGGISVCYCATDCCLKIEASPTGHECTSVWAWKRACRISIVLHCHLKPCLAKSTSYVARFNAEPKNDPIPSTICFHSVQ